MSINDFRRSVGMTPPPEPQTPTTPTTCVCGTEYIRRHGAAERRRVLAEVLRGLESEEQTTQVRAIIAQIRAMLAEADHE